MSLNRVIDCIRKNKSFLITAHHNLEGDALGSEIAFYNLLRKLGKSAIIVNQDRTPKEYAFLKGSRFIRRYRQGMRLKFDVLVMLDCSDRLRCGRVVNLAQSAQKVINIDHHISNDQFADFNWVLPGASSASEMVYRLYKIMHVKLDKVSAEALYVGTLTDTGSFRYINTSSFTHQMAAELLKFNLTAYKIYRNIYATISFSDISLLPKILLTIQRYASGKIITFDVKQKLLKGKKIYFDLTENVLSFGRLIAGCEVCVLFKEQPDRTGQIRVNLRSQGPVADVNRVARFFGGGGHKTASGCTVKGNLESVKNRVIRKIRQQL